MATMTGGEMRTCVKVWISQTDMATVAGEAARRSATGKTVRAAELVRDAVARMADEIRLREESGTN